MSGSKPKAIPQVNLEEFEWRLRASIAGQSHVEDPLAELTRLVDNFHVDDEAAAVVNEDNGFSDRLEPSFTHPPGNALTLIRIGSRAKRAHSERRSACSCRIASRT